MENSEHTQTIPATRRERLSWYLYDFANTSFTVLIVTALFPLLFEELAELYFMDDYITGQALWGFAGSVTMAIVALMSPILGAIADYTGSKKRFLVFFTLLCVFFNAMLFFTSLDTPIVLGMPIWLWAWVFFIIANVGFEGALPFYDAWLPEISDETTIGKISGFGYAAGYLGAMFTIIIALVSVLALGTYSTVPYLLGAVFFLVFAIPAIMGLKDRPPHRFTEEIDPSGKLYAAGFFGLAITIAIVLATGFTLGILSYLFGIVFFVTWMILANIILGSRRSIESRPSEKPNIVLIGFSRIARTIREIRSYQGVPLFMVAYFLFSDAISTVIAYAAIFGRAVYGFEPEMILIFFAVTQLAAIPGAFIFGYIADHIGTKRTLMITLVLWIFALFIAFIGEGAIIWWSVGMMAGVGMGSAQSTARSMYGQFMPEETKAEMFGLLAFTGRFAAILGPFVYGVVILYSGSLGLGTELANRYALLSVLFFFVLALIILLKVQQPVKGKSKVGAEVFLALDDDFVISDLE
ncbi:MAG: MFS transporter [Candidatus Thorarchaeota archaeon]|nr:MFS transporter [Candidatus Thorarchaeota archaeon]